MTHRSRWALLAAVALSMLAGFGVTQELDHSATPDEGDPRPAAAAAAVAAPSGARTALPGLTPASGEPTLPGFTTARPAEGTVARVSGPFDERYTWSGLHFADGRLSGDLTVTSDVSDLLELEVLVGFYDTDGQLLDIRRVVRHHTLHQDTGGHVPEESMRVVVDVPHNLRTDSVAAAVGVPVLVNE